VSYLNVCVPQPHVARWKAPWKASLPGKVASCNCGHVFWMVEFPSSFHSISTASLDWGVSTLALMNESHLQNRTEFPSTPILDDLSSFTCRCKMGGLTVLHRPPAPRYDFEMLNAETGELYLHFQVLMRAWSSGPLSLRQSARPFSAAVKFAASGRLE